jgi:hypothetical protein
MELVEAGARWLALVALAGCGRIGFAGESTNDASSGSDAASDASDAPRGVMAPVFAQTASSFDPSGTGSLSVTLNNVVAGNMIVLETDVRPIPVGIASITDSAGNAYVLAPAYTGGDASINLTVVFAYAIATTSGAVTVMTTTTGANLTQELRVAEYAQIDPNDPFDAIAWGTSGTASATDGARTSELTTTAPNDLLFSILLYTGIDGVAGTGFSARSMFNYDVLQDRILPTPGTYTAFATSPGSGWVIGGIALRGTPL